MREIIEQGFAEVFQFYMMGRINEAQGRLEELIVELESL